MNEASELADRIADLAEKERNSLGMRGRVKQLATELCRAYGESCAAQARAKWQVPEGWKLVPVEPTPEILWAGRGAFRREGLLPAYTDGGAAGGRPIIVYILEKAWPEMLDASPAPPAPGEG